MSYGCFVDIYQQDGKPVRMFYENLTPDTVRTITWIGAMEQMGEKFNAGKRAVEGNDGGEAAT